MILVDSSVWIDHLRISDERLDNLLNANRVYVHPMVIGEISLGNIRRRDVVLSELKRLPRIVVANDGEVMQFVERHKLFGLGVGYVDVHLLTAVRLSLDASLWTRDRRLFSVASRMGLAAAFLR